MTAKRHSQPITLGVLGTGLVTVMQNDLWQGAMQAARQHGARLIYYPTVGLDSFPPFTPASQVLFDFVDGEHLDGILIWYAGLHEGVIAVHGDHFFDRYQGLPVVTIGYQHPSFPDISVDNVLGVRAAVEHLIRVHGRQHFGIVRGPVGHPDADERYQACVEALHAHQLAVNPDRVAETLFALGIAAQDTYAAVTGWLKDSGSKLEAIVAASDYMALAAIKAVEAAGLRVPDDIAVVGFDDITDAQAHIPSLTTVRQPFYEMGRQAVDLLMAVVNGQTVPYKNLMPSSLVVRESCGCVSLADWEGATAAKPHTDTTLPPGERLTRDLAELARGTEFPVAEVAKLAEYLREGIHPESSRRFLSALRPLVIRTITEKFDVALWHAAISALRDYALAGADDCQATQAENFFIQARVLVVEAQQRVLVRQRMEAEEQAMQLRRTSEELLASFGRQALLRAISERLPMLGFTGVYLSLYEDPEHPEAWSNLILAHRNGESLDLPPEGVRFSTRELVPPGLLPETQITPMVVEPLYFGMQPLGILVLEVGPTQGVIYENLRAQISNALQGSRLLSQVHDHAAQLEQRVASRTDDLKQAVTQLVREIAERQQAQEALAHERNLLRTLVDSMPDIIFAKDVQGRFILKNETDAHTMGAKSPEETIGKTDFDYYPAEIAERFKADDDLVIETGTPLINREEMNVDAAGRIRCMLTTKVPLCDAQGKVIGLVGMSRDISERKQAEEALRQSEEIAREFQEKLKGLQEISLELVAADSFEQLCIKSIELGCRVLGYDRLGLLLFEDAAQTVASRFGIESNGQLRSERGVSYPAQNDSMILSGVLADRQSVYVNEDATLGDFEHAVGHGWNVVTGIWDGTTSIGWLAADNLFNHKPLLPYQVELLNIYGLTIGHLVTRKRAEAEIRRLNDELEQRVIKRTAELQAAHDRLQVLSRAKDDFVSNVSHELRTPITNIKLYHELLEKRPDKFDHYTAILRREINRLESLIEALLMLSRLDQNREKISLVSRDLHELLRQFVADRAALAAAKNIALELEVEPEPITVMADQRLFEQVLSILLTNALAYTPSGGCITVRSRQRVTDGKKWVGFSVTDTGFGIAPEEQERLFDRFFRGRAGRDSNMPGTGLGLSIAREIVDRHQGIIEFSSEGLGHGTTFTVWLASP